MKKCTCAGEYIYKMSLCIESQCGPQVYPPMHNEQTRSPQTSVAVRVSCQMFTCYSAGFLHVISVYEGKHTQYIYIYIL